jgi:hypothetical protein
VAKKNHNPGCPCCNPCKCFWSEEPTRVFSGTPTVKVVIAGIPDSIGPFTLNRNLFGTTSFLDEYTISGWSAINGTYFFEVPKQENGCIVDFTSSGSFPTPFATELIPYDVDITTTEYTLSGSTCTTVGVTSQSLSLDAVISLRKHSVAFAGENPGDLTASLFALGQISGFGSNLWRMGGRVVMQCRHDYDYTLTPSSVVNSFLLENDGTYEWPVNSGELKFGREIRAIFTRCGFGPEYSQFQDFGTIEAELLDL